MPISFFRLRRFTILFAAGRHLVSILLLATLAGCVSPQVDLDDPGRVSGELLVFWVGEDEFVYYPYFRDPLTYRLPAAIADKLGTKVIQPGAIYTDGGSIPRAVRGVVGFSPWGYGPAYIVHDWLFVAHHCIAHDAVEAHDPRDRDEVETVRKVDFDLSADILANVIEALAKQNKVPRRALAPSAIYTAVDSVVARNLWNSRDPESCHPVEAKRIKEIERKLAGGFAAAAKPRKALGDFPVGQDFPVLVYRQTF